MEVWSVVGCMEVVMDRAMGRWPRKLHLSKGNTVVFSRIKCSPE
jgi:hypothetical protein